MKTKFTLVAVLIAAFFTGSAQQIPNGSFENWTSPLNPDGWVSVESAESVPVNVVTFEDNTTFTQGAASLKLLADSTSLDAAVGVIPGFVSLGSAAIVGNQINFVGIPFAYRPDSLIFDYKLASPGVDTATITVVMTQGGTTTVLGVTAPLFVVSNWTHIAVPLASFYQSGVTPDTLLVIIDATDPQFPVDHDTLHVDGLRFGYVVTPITATIAAGGPTTFCTGDSVQLTSNTGNYTYQWNLNGTAITGATGATYWAKASGSYTVTLDSTSTSATSSAIVVLDTTCTAINTIAAAHLSVYPNPASTLMTVSSTTNLSGYSLQVYDVVGQMVISQVLESSNNNVNVAKLANGSYIYRITNTANEIIAQSKFNVIK